MTTFKEIRGTAIQVVSSDPSNPETGQIWYNSSSGTLKGYQLANVNAWASGGNTNHSGSNMSGTGSQTAALILGGEGTPSFPTSTEKYNGTSWTTTGNYPRGIIGPSLFGSQTAAVAAGGVTDTVPPAFNTGETNTFNGTSWTTVPATLNQARSQMAFFGSSQTAGIACGGDQRSGGTFYSNTEQWNGSIWTAKNALNTARGYFAGGGTETAAVVFGGSISPYPTVSAATETWNGTSWTSVTSMGTGRQFVSGTPAGTQTAVLAISGQTSVATPSTAVEQWNGSSWTTVPSVSTARVGGAGVGSATLGLIASGGNPLTATEEWTGQALQVKTITVS